MRELSRQALLAALLVLALLAGCAGGGASQGVVTSAPPTEGAATAPTPAPTEAAATIVPTEAAPSPTAEALPTKAATDAAARPTGEATAAATEAAATDSVPEGALVSIPATAAPELDGSADDPTWADAPATEIATTGGANESDTTVTLKSVHTDDMVYFLLQWEDPTESWLRQPWEKQADGTWAPVRDPNDKGGDNNEFYEDKLALIWNINDSIQNFDTAGCFALCHAGENSDVKPYGNKYTQSEGEIGDIWHWKSVRNLNQVDDQYVDHTRYSADTPEAGRKSDPKDAGGYVNNETEDKKGPAFMPPNGGAKDGSPGYILDSEKVQLDDTLFKAGDRVPGIIKSEMTGDRGELSAGWKWADGTWTLEVGRKLVTSSEFDVQFDDRAGTYHFGLATFDNAQVRHAFESGVTPFVFEQ